MPPVIPDNLADQCPVASLHAIVIHGGERPLEEVESWVQSTLESLLPLEGQSSEHVVGRETHAWTPQGFPKPVSAHGIFLRSDRESRNALTLGRTIRTQMRDAFCREHPEGSLILLSRSAFTATDVAALTLCHRDPKDQSRGTWVEEPMSAPYLPPPFTHGQGWGISWTRPDVMESVLDVFIERRVESHWGPLLSPVRQQQLEAQLPTSSQGSRPRF